MKKYKNWSKWVNKYVRDSYMAWTSQGGGGGVSAYEFH